ncbi:hypothetical protein BIV57_06380 [Mangrovactinospora gilvigrisea]|uniref:DUF742 domain-containing protein n=1 Tax=Mangrovactinospora gilvigrisea TaxID=1428644 RepID=A0A1J7BXW6_9ACTN|nr:DUF742 domain-containing protein [Mangrovactinospora gilvigrisea]OIV38345.1 hypothetical protein BIV57_06380 [Mangrovactinospora gilvigrisea]
MSDGDSESLVRPYTITRGRTAPERTDLTLITQVTASDRAGEENSRDARRLQPEHRAILGRCRHPAAVAEIAAAVDLPVSVTKILIGDLIAEGWASARPPLAVAEGEGGAPDIRLLQAVRDGLRKL